MNVQAVPIGWTLLCPVLDADKVIVRRRIDLHDSPPLLVYKGSGPRVSSPQPSRLSTSPLTTFPPTLHILRVLIIMKFSTFILSILSAAVYVSAQTPNATTKTAELLEGLQKAPTRLARLNVLADNTDVSTPYRSLWSLKSNMLTQWLFDYTSGLGTTKSAGGNLTAANVANFPALFANGLAMTIGQME